MIVDKESLLESLSVAAKNAGDGRSIIEALSSIHIYDRDGRLFIEATNIEQAVVAEVTATDVDEINVLVDASKFNAVVSAMAGDTVKLTLTETQLKISAGEQRANIAINTNVEEFPELPEFPEEGTWFVGREFVDILNSVAFSLSPSHTKPVHRSIYFESIDPTHVRMIAFDQTRIAINQFETRNPLQEELKLLVPVKILKDFSKYVKGDADIEMAFAKNRLMLKTGNAIFMVTIYSDKFPDVMAGIPKNLTESYQFDSALADQAAAAAQIFAKDNLIQSDLVRFSVKNGTGYFSAKSENGDMVAPFPVTSENNTDVEHGSDVTLLRAAFGVGGENLKLSFDGNKGAKAIWHFTTPDMPHWVHVVMPITIR